MAKWFGTVPKQKVVITYYKLLAEVEQTENYEWPANLEAMLFKQI